MTKKFKGRTIGKDTYSRMMKVRKGENNCFLKIQENTGGIILLSQKC